jgi:sulfide:quinone oxidoreductase
LPDTTVVVLGCGMGGVAAATELRRLLPKRHRVVCIDRDERASYPPSYLWLATGERKSGQISRDRARLARRGVEFVHAEVRELDLSTRRIWADSREFKFDYLVMAMGMERSVEGVPGLAEGHQSFVTLEGAERLAATLRYFAGGKVVIASAPGARTYPFAGYEAAMLIEHHFHERKMRQKVEIDLYTPEPEPFAFGGAEASETIIGLLAHKGIGLKPGQELTAVDHTRKEAFFQEKLSTDFDLLIAQPTTRPPKVAIEAGLSYDDGWIQVDPQTMETAAENVFAVGDSTWLGSRGTFPAGGFAQEQGQRAAAEIAYRTEGGRRPRGQAGRTRFFIDIGAGAAAAIETSLVSTAEPEFRQPSIVWHWAKRGMERYWLLRAY